MENKRKNYNELTTIEKQQIIQYRKRNGECFTKTRILLIIKLCSYFLLTFINSVISNYSPKLFLFGALLWVLTMFYIIADAYLIRYDDENWYYKNIEKIYEKEILK